MKTQTSSQSDNVLKINHFSYQINDFKIFLRNNLANVVQKSVLHEFMSSLDTNQIVNEKFYDALGLVNELNGIEDQYFLLRNKISFIPIYKSLLKRIESFAKNKPNMELEEEQVLQYLYSATLSKLLSMKQNKLHGNTVADITQHLSNTLNYIKNWKQATTNADIIQHRNEYIRTLNQRKEEANNFVIELHTDITNIENDIDTNIYDLINKLLGDRKKKKKEIENSKEIMKELQRKMGLKLLLSGVKLMGGVISLLIPGGAILGAAIVAGSTLGNNLISGNDGTLSKVSPLADGVYKTLSDKYEKEKMDLDKRLMLIQKRLIYLKDSGKSEDINILDKCQKLTKLNLETGEESRKLVESAKKEFIEALEQIQGTLKHKMSVATVEKCIKVDRLDNVKELLTLPDSIVDIYNTYHTEKTKIDVIADAIKGLTNQLQKWQKFEKNVNKMMIPLFQKMKKDIKSSMENMIGKHHAALDISSWSIKSALSKLWLKFNEMIAGFDGRDKIFHNVVKLEKTLETITSIFDRIDTYTDKESLVEFLTDIISASSKSINIKNVKFLSAITSLEPIIQSNLVLERHENSIYAFKQHYFPMALQFLQDTELQNNLKMHDTQTLANNSANIVNGLITKVANSESKLTYYDHYTQSEASFKYKKSVLDPFYVWQYENIKNEMKQLLLGNMITLKADITNGLPYNAVKFNDIQISLSIPNEILKTDDMQTRLNDKFYEFQVNYRMMGNQYFRCGKQIHYIPLDEDLCMSHSFKSDSETNIEQGIYNKIIGHFPFLSPYTTWSFQLISANKTNFDNIAEFIDMPINLELIGMGSFIKEIADDKPSFSSKYCGKDLQKYYKMYNGNFD